jgi:hypothetical protein
MVLSKKAILFMRIKCLLRQILRINDKDLVDEGSKERLLFGISRP